MWILVTNQAASARDYFTEAFNGGSDISFSTFTFKPDGSSNGYAVCRLPATEFPTPTNGAAQRLTGLELVARLYAGSRTIPFFGVPYSEIWVNGNGSVTFGGFDDSYDASVSNHFRLPRVSAWLGRLGWEYPPSYSYHPVLYVALSNRLVLTWSNLPERGAGGSNSVQLELFFDGVIRLTYLRMEASDGVVGLSPGGGVPADFIESDLSNAGCAGTALYRFEWSSLPAAAPVGQPFPVTVSGRDAFNLDFPVNGTARLIAGQRTVVFHSDFEQDAAGFTFSNTSPAFSNGWHVTTYRGTQPGHSISRSMYSGRADAPTAEERGAPAQGAVVSPLIDLRDVYPPITLSFAQLATSHNGVVEVQVEGQTPIWIAGASGMDFPANTWDRWEPVALDLSAFSGKRIRMRFNTGSSTHSHWLIDDVTVVGVSNAVPISPSMTGVFSGSSWSGTVSLSAPGTVVLVAVDSHGVFGTSAPIDVTAPDDLSLHTMAPNLNLHLGRTGSVDLMVSNSGPSTATAVAVTNFIPSGAILGQVAVSQGSYSVAGNQLLLNLGDIGGGGYALASFEFTAAHALSLAWTSVVGRAAGEPFLGNNRSVATVNFGNPIVRALPAWASEAATNIVVRLRLDETVPVPVSVNFMTVSDTATAGEDFVPTNGTVTFAPFTSEVQVPIAVIDDALFEDHPNPFANDAPEFFRVEITPATNAVIAEGTSICTLADNDPVPTLSILTTNVMEGHSGTTLAPVVLRLSAPVGKPTDITFYTETGTAFHYDYGGYALMGTARMNEDFVALSNSFEFAPGETQRVIYVESMGDTATEPDETFTLVLESNVLLPRVSVFRPTHFYAPITIVDDDPPVLLADDYRIVAETCANNVVDPGETVTVLFRVRNAGYNVCSSSNLVATLLPGGGVLNPSGPQNYGALCGAMDEWRPFTLTAAASCGSNISATLSFSDDGTNRGTSTVNLPVGQRGRVLQETFDGPTGTNLPPGWVASTYENSPLQIIHEGSNQFVRIDFRHWSAGNITLTGPGFVVTSSNAWLRLRHRFEIIPENAAANFGGRQFSGSSRGWTVSAIPVSPDSIGSTQRMVFHIVRLYAPTTAIWEIDSVEVFDGPATCCDGAAPLLLSARREAGRLVLQWRSVSNQTYQVQFRGSLASGEWSDLGAPIIGDGPLTSVTNTMGASNGFFRVRAGP